MREIGGHDGRDAASAIRVHSGAYNAVQRRPLMRGGVAPRERSRRRPATRRCDLFVRW